VSAWSEIAAWISSAAIYGLLQWLWPDAGFGWHLIVVALSSTACWVLVTFATPPTTPEKLLAFYRRVRPSSPGWRPVAARAGITPSGRFASDGLTWLAGVVLVFSTLFGFGKLLLFGVASALPYAVVAAASAWLVGRALRAEA
jgi:hypothetical protein